MLNFLDVRRHSKKFISLLLFFNLISVTSSYRNVYLKYDPVNLRVCALLAIEHRFIYATYWSPEIFSALNLVNRDVEIWLVKLKAISVREYNDISVMIRHNSDYDVCPYIHTYLKYIDMLSSY